MTNRLADADQRLQRLVAERMSQPFAWGRQDCAMFAADCAGACTGLDLASDLRGRYRSEQGAYRLLRRLYGNAPWPVLLANLCAARLGASIAVALAVPGDVGLALHRGMHVLAVCVGPHWLAPAAQGLTPVDAPERAWRLPCPR